MKYLLSIAITAGILASTPSRADTVIREAHDNTGGSVYGGIAGLLIGGFSGGPLGALAGAGIGAFAGHHTQDATGLSQRSYLIENEQGEQIVVRSPAREFAPGDTVQHRSGRLYSAQ